MAQREMPRRGMPEGAVERHCAQRLGQPFQLRTGFTVASVDGTSPVITLSACIQVSGYPAVPAHRIVAPSGKDGVVSKDTRIPKLSWFRPATLPPRALSWRGCRNPYCCHQYETARVPMHERGVLGWVGYCTTCVAHYVALCTQKYGRLPKLKREFFCPHCETMRQHPEDRSSLEADGRVRVKCWPCRRADVARNNARARDRARAEPKPW